MLISAAAAVWAAGTPAQAVTGGTPAAAGSHPYAAHIQVAEERACSGVLVAPQWVLTTATCFAPDGRPPAAGPPAAATTVTVGRVDLAEPGGHVAPVTRLVPRPDRNLVLAKLGTPAAGLAPAALAAGPASTGDALRAGGYGRTATEWVPDRLHTGAFTVDSVSATALAIHGEGSANLCKGDAGGPVLREQNGKSELVAISDSSWQAGCFGSTETRAGATAVRVDDLGAWIAAAIRPTPEADVTGDGKADVIIQRADGSLSAWSSSGDLSADGRLLTESGTGVTVGYGFGTESIPRLFLADLNGDGKADVIAQRASGELSAWTSTGDMTGPMKLLADAGSGKGVTIGSGFSTASIPRMFFADVTGDGRADLIAQHADAAGTLTAWSSTGDLSGDLKLYPRGVTIGSGFGTVNIRRIFLSDITGDGKADLIGQRETGGKLSAWRSTGDLSGDSKLLSDNGNGIGVTIGSGFGTTALPRVFFTDITGDGKADLVGQRADANGTLSAWRSTGDLSADSKLLSDNGNGTGVTVGTGFAQAGIPRLSFTDVTGDGKADLIGQRSDTKGTLSAWRGTGDTSADKRLFPAGVTIGTGFSAPGIARILGPVQ